MFPRDLDLNNNVSSGLGVGVRVCLLHEAAVDCDAVHVLVSDLGFQVFITGYYTQPSRNGVQGEIIEMFNGYCCTPLLDLRPCR